MCLCAVKANFNLCLQFQIEDMNDHTHALSSTKESSSPKKWYFKYHHEVRFLTN